MLRKEIEDIVTTADISFRVKSTIGNKPTGAFVTYNIVELNRGNSLNGTTGIFTAPKAGTYLFNFHARVNSKGAQKVQMRSNGSEVMNIYYDLNTEDSKYRHCSMSTVLSLNVNDKVGVFLVEGAITGSSFFSGILVREKK